MTATVVARSRWRTADAVLWASDLTGCAALVMLPVWVLHLLNPPARPGREIMVVVGVVAVVQLVRPRARAAIIATALGAALGVAAAV